MDHILSSLDALGLRFGTDKSSAEHDYLSFYETFFDRMRHEPVKLLEIGVLFGSSLNMWQEYFPQGIVIGGDIHPGVKSQVAPRIFTEVVDQSNIEDLVHLGVKHGPFDVIIEDGSHRWEDQITTLRTLFPFLKNGGFYIVEDLHTNFGNLALQFGRTSSISCVEYLKKLVDLRVADDQIDILDQEDPFLRTYGRNVQSITFYRRACLLQKKYSSGRRGIDAPGLESNDIEDGSLANAPLTPTPGMLSIVCHIGEIGDRQSTSGAIRVLRDDVSIQGFVIYCDNSIGADLEYRARLANGVWTDWVGCGHFAGTMGKSQDLSGFSARLSGPSEKTYDIDLAGLFREQANTVLITGGGDCVSKAGANPLYGMQLILQHKLEKRAPD